MRRYVLHEVPLIGRGLIHQDNFFPKPGDFYKLVNVDVLPDGIRARRPILNVNSSVYNFYKGKPKFLGLSEERVIWATGDYNGPDISDTNIALGYSYTSEAGDEHTAYAEGTVEINTIFASTVTKFYKLIKYNDKYYYVFRRGSRPTDTICVSENDELNMVASNLLDMPTRDSYKDSIGDDYVHDIVESFIFKDRLFLFSRGGTVYYSKATEPWNTAVADGGGFFLLPDVKINHAFVYRDAIYIITDRSIYSFSFATDPGTDGSVTSISNSEISGHYGISHRGIPYVVNNDGLYRVLNGYVEQVADLQVDQAASYAYSNWTHKLAVLNDLIYIIRSPADYEESSRSRLWAEINVDGTYEPSCAVLTFNTESGALSTLDFVDNYSTISGSATSRQGTIIDAINNSIESEGHYGTEETIYWLTWGWTDVSNPHGVFNVYATKASYFGENAWNNTIHDLMALCDSNLLTGNNVIENSNFHIEVETVPIVPDGFEHFYKHFKHLLVMGEFFANEAENDLTEFTASFDGAVIKEVQLQTDNNPNSEAPSPYTGSLHQRARSVVLNFKLPWMMFAGYRIAGARWALSRIHLTWAPTNRAPKL